MNIVESIALGVVQGLTEFIPVSSSGHEVLTEYFFGTGHDHLFLEFINIGTVLALLIYFRAKIGDLLEEVIFRHNWRLARNIFISAVPAGVIGLLFADVIEKNSFFSSPWVVAIMMLLVGALMIGLEKIPRLGDTKDGEALSKRRSLAIGLAQAVALIPGTSRSGSTIIAGRLVGLSPAAAAEYSFLLSIPIMLGVIAKLFLKSSDRAYFMANIPTIAISNFFAFVSGMVAIGFLMRYLSKHNLSVFGWYRVALSVVVIALLLLQ
jgi:undecaprenyl-diphosphatase